MYIKPFQGYLYNTTKVNYTDVVSPPYDVIDDKLYNTLVQKSPYNIVKATLPKAQPKDVDYYTKYLRAQEFLNQLISENILVQDSAPAFYLNKINFTDPLTGEEKSISTILALLDLENSKSQIYPHENVLEAPIVDRINLLHATSANFGSVYILYEDNEFILEDKVIKKVTTCEPITQYENIDNSRHTLYRISNPDDIKFIEEFLKNKEGYIADGHHRYYAALKYYEFKQFSPQYRYRLIAISNAHDKNIVILPTHRTIYKKPVFNSVDEFLNLLRKYYDITEINENLSYTLVKNEILQLNQQPFIAFLVYLNKYKKLFKLYSRLLTDYSKILSINASNRLKNINTAALHYLILPLLYNLTPENMKVPEEITFSKSLTDAIKDSENENVDAIFFLPPIKIDDLLFIAKLGEKLPLKTSYFYPKIPSGIVIYKF